ncbi:hypothetical protein BURMUCF2_B0180, partial [Burkholderia multivorans CF2]
MLLFAGQPPAESAAVCLRVLVVRHVTSGSESRSCRCSNPPACARHRNCGTARIGTDEPGGKDERDVQYTADERRGRKRDAPRRTAYGRADAPARARP